MSTTRELLNDASMGDSAAITALAQKIDAAASPGEIAGQVAGMVAQQAQAREIATQFKSANPDLFADPLTAKLVFQQDLELQRLRPHMQLGERFEAAGREVRKWLAEKRGTATASPRRESAPPVRRAAAQRQQAREAWDVADGEPEENVSDVIAQMAASRRPNGKPVWHPRFETDTPPDYYFDE